jgi:hypothetical protein
MPSTPASVADNSHVMILGAHAVVDTGGIGTEIGAGEAYDIAPSHDAWIVGNDTFVGLEFRSADQYAQPKNSSPGTGPRSAIRSMRHVASW